MHHTQSSLTIVINPYNLEAHVHFDSSQGKRIRYVLGLYFFSIFEHSRKTMARSFDRGSFWG